MFIYIPIYYINQFFIPERFYTAWYDEGSEPAEWKFFVLLYFMAYDRVEIYESKKTGNRSGQNPFPLFLGKIRLPKDWSNLPRK